jgi:3-hydroxybutyrate dehydrogenase
MRPERFLQGRSAIVTGGTSGIGKAIALAFASAGADVAVGSRSAAISPCKAEIEAQGVRCLAINVDVRSMDSVQEFCTAVVKGFGHIDILVNSAGVCHYQVLCGHLDEIWSESIDVNLNGVYRTTTLCLPGMIARKWGRIINIASDIALVGMAEYAAYCASKAALVVLTRCAALEGAPHGVSCNTISPGWVDTDMAKRAIASAKEMGSMAEYIEKIRQNGPQSRMINPKEIAALTVFLCRDEARGITMQDVTVSGAALWYQESRR